MARDIFGDDHSEDAAEERPRRLEPGEDRGGRLGEGQPHEAVPAVAGGEDQGLTHPRPAGLGVGDEAHLAEVHLKLPARLPVGDAHGGGAGRATHAEDLQCVAVQGALGHDGALAAQQLMRLDRGETLGDNPGLELIVVGHQHRPGDAVAVGTMWAYRLAHLGQQHVVQLLLAAGAVEAGVCGGSHVAPHCLAVDRRQALDRSQSLPSNPQSQHFSDLVHTNLPEHGHLPGPLVGQVAESTGSGAAAGGSQGWSYDWRKGGPMLLAELTSRWSHVAGGRHLRVITKMITD